MNTKRLFFIIVMVVTVVMSSCARDPDVPTGVLFNSGVSDEPSVVYYNITTDVNPAGVGTVSGAASYASGTTATLEAFPNKGWVFTEWQDGNTENPRAITVTSDATYTANFKQKTTTIYNVTVLSNDLTLGEVTGGGSYPEGAEITLEAYPSGIGNFVKWDDGNTDNPRTIIVDNDYTFIAIFEMPTYYTITVESTNPEWGSVSGGGQFQMSEWVTFWAIPNSGYYFNGWTDDNYDNPRAIIVEGDATYKAKFSQEQNQAFTLTLTCDPNQGYVSGGGNYLSGDDIVIQATPYEGFEFSQWSDGNMENPRTVTINGNMLLIAIFISWP